MIIDAAISTTNVLATRTTDLDRHDRASPAARRPLIYTSFAISPSGLGALPRSSPWPDSSSFSKRGD